MSSRDRVGRSIGALRHRLQIQRLVTPAQRTAFGGIDNAADANWETVGWRYASIEALNGNEPQFANQISADLSHKITVRFWRDRLTGAPIGPAFRFLWARGKPEINERIFNIKSVLNQGEQQKGTLVECMCNEEA